jgi:hypothetical protein
VVDAVTFPLDLDDLPLDVVELTARGYEVESLTAQSSPVPSCIYPCSCFCGSNAAVADSGS